MGLLLDFLFFVFCLFFFFSFAFAFFDLQERQNNTRAPVYYLPASPNTGASRECGTIMVKLLKEVTCWGNARVELKLSSFAGFSSS